MNFSFLKPKRRIEVIRRSQNKLRLHEWRSEKSLVSSAMRLLRDPDFQMMLDVLENEHPGAGIVLPDNVGLEVRAIQQARSEGYTIALANLEALGRFEPMSQTLEATFEPEEVEKPD